MIADKSQIGIGSSRFNSVGSTICYAFMQAAGMVNDHVVTCFRYREAQR